MACPLPTGNCSRGYSQAVWGCIRNRVVGTATECLIFWMEATGSSRQRVTFCVTLDSKRPIDFSIWLLVSVASQVTWVSHRWLSYTGPDLELCFLCSQHAFIAQSLAHLQHVPLSEEQLAQMTGCSGALCYRLQLISVRSQGIHQGRIKRSPLCVSLVSVQSHQAGRCGQ